jgi:superfamily I DNA/RNA helicase/RecB family exonuclease
MPADQPATFTVGATHYRWTVMNPVTELRDEPRAAAAAAARPARPAGTVPLDASQRAVLDLPIDRSAAVIGAPGSGKTTTLVEFVADRVLGHGYSPSEVLVLVPTRTGATTLRDRLALRLRVPTNGPLARTMNSVAFQIVRDAEVAAGRTSPTLLTGGEQDQIIAEILQGDILEGTGPAWPSPLDAEVRALRGFRTELRDLMMRAVEYGVTPGRLAGFAADTDRAEWAAAAAFIRDYQEVKDQSRPGQFDSTELVQFAAALVQDAPRVARRPAGTGPAASSGNPLGPLGELRLIVLDDAQEATQSTLALLAQFAARGVTIVAFGDPDLSTGSFRGAHPDALGRLGSYLGLADVATLNLDTVYRHGTELRAVIHEFTGRIGAAAAGTQRAARSVANREAAAAAAPVAAPAADVATADPAGRADPAAAHSDPAHSVPVVPTGAVQTVVTASPADQLAVIARRLRERHVLDGLPWGRMAVIVRTGALVPALSKGLAALEVPTQVAASQAALRDEPAVRAFILALDITLGRRPLDADAAVELLRGPFGGLDPITLRRLRAALRQQELSAPEPAADGALPAPGMAEGARTADELLVQIFTDPALLESIDNRTARRAASCAKNLRQTRTAFAAGATIEELLWGLWQRSGLAPAWAEQATGTGIDADEANSNLDAVVALFSAAQRFVERTPAAPPVLFVEHLVDTDVPEDTLAPRALAESVLVSTPSGTIGRDYDLVVLAGVQENVWPDLRIRGSLLGSGDLALQAAGETPDPAGARTSVLHDELRMFAQAASRCTTELLVTAVDNDENQPSAFLRLLPEPDPAPLARYPLSLRGLVGRLRRDLTQTLRPRLQATTDGAGGAGADTDAVAALPAVLPVRATDAAATLARLAREKVPGAAPAEWYGLRPASTERPLNDPEAGDGPVRVSPSRMSAFETCPLHWLIGQIGGGESSTAANLGTIIHKVMEDATDPALSPDPASITADALWAGVEARWGELVFDADWQSRVQKLQARELTDRLAAYLGDGARDGTRLLSAEGKFALELDGAVLSGTIDRVERLPDGRAVIVDLKTGKGDPTSDTGVAEHPQLGAYQLAFSAGVIDGLEPGMELAGARLVIVSSGTQKQNYRNPTQPAFTPDELATFTKRVTDDAAGMGAATFVAEIADHCLDPRSYGSCRIHVIKQVSS